MAKRKRLSPTPFGPVTQSARPAPAGPGAPIARVASDAAQASAAQEMADALAQAREGGRMILSLPLSEIDEGYLVRDRVSFDDEEMQVLMDSIAARGQQTPIEVAAHPEGGYGLISGWRRLSALRFLHQDTGEARFATVDALLRRPDTAAEAYLAMIEENEIRSGLSYYERARIVLRAVDEGVFQTQSDALQTLFAASSRARRSKIGSFVPIVEALGGRLAFPRALGERLGLKLSRALQEDPALGPRLAEALSAHRSPTPEHEQSRLARALAGPKPDRPAPEQSEPVAGVTMIAHPEGRVVLEGARVDADLAARLSAWLRETL